MARFRYAQVEANLPEGWEARGFSRATDDDEARTYSVLHLANFALPGRVEDYGGGAVEVMRASDVFMSLIEFGPESVGTALFSDSRRPRFTKDSFDPNGLQRGIPGQSGAQHFFTANGRPYSLYVVLGEHLMRLRISPVLNAIVQGIQLGA